MNEGSRNDPMDNPSLNSSLANMLHISVLILSNTIIGQDRTMRSYCGLKLADIPTSGTYISKRKETSYNFKARTYPCTKEIHRYSLNQTIVKMKLWGPSHVRAAKKTPKGAVLTSARVSAAYHNVGPSSYQCCSCNATMWYEERNDKAKRATKLTLSLCCQEGKVILPRFNETPPPLKTLLDFNDLTTLRFEDQIRVYNENEIRNRMSAFVDNETHQTVDQSIVARMIQMLDSSSAIAKTFRMEKD
uniref:Uncharacterized protein n=1 Tax=Tanacetum cinerariifolium TaxID=118510 RepID=A0A6L2KCC9_TANCI|nr:hypothetical protein [Tanacetum cinerariifolium]